MEDMQQRDLSHIPDHKLTAEERRELQRRMRVFLNALKAGRAGGEPRFT